MTASQRNRRRARREKRKRDAKLSRDRYRNWVSWSAKRDTRRRVA